MWGCSLAVGMGLVVRELVVLDSQNVLWLAPLLTKGLNCVVPRAAKWFIVCWHEEAWCSHKIDVWLAYIVSSTIWMILPSLANRMICSLSVMHFSREWLMTIWYQQYFGSVVLPPCSGHFGSGNSMTPFSRKSWRIPNKSKSGSGCFFPWSSFSVAQFLIASSNDVPFLSTNLGFLVV